MWAVVAVLLVLSPMATSRVADEAAVLGALHRACDAFRDGDVPYLESFLAVDFTLTDSSGKVAGREATLAEVRAREPRYEIFRNHTMTVRFYDSTALVNGVTSVKGTAAGRPFAVDVQFTDTLVRENGAWRLVATHASRIAN